MPRRVTLIYSSKKLQKQNHNSIYRVIHNARTHETFWLAVLINCKHMYCSLEKKLKVYVDYWIKIQAWFIWKPSQSGNWGIEKSDRIAWDAEVIFKSWSRAQTCIHCVMHFTFWTHGCSFVDETFGLFLLFWKFVFTFQVWLNLQK